jgi:hypothetical protein
VKTLNVRSEAENQTKSNGKTENQELISKLEKQVTVAVWIKFIGSILEAIYLSRIMMLSEDEKSDPNERQAIQGIWIQTIGTFIDNIGITKQSFTSDETAEFEGSLISNTGDWIQVMGGILEAYAGKQIIIKEQQEVDLDPFLP